MSKTETEAKQGKVARKGGAKTIMLMILIGCVVPFGLPTLIVCLGLIPTVVALFTDADDNRSSLATVGYLNFAGVLPYLIDLWQKGQTMDAALSIVRDPSSWVVMLGAAGMGHLILYAVPPVIASIIVINHESRLRTLRDGLTQLEAIWGPDVANTSAISEVLKSRGV